MMRIGHGFDVHRFSTEAGTTEEATAANNNSKVILGGVSIDYSHTLLAHSDGDVLLHAVCDALLGAAALGDIGQHFPNTDPRYKGIDSRQLLRHVVALIHKNGYQVVNVDSTIVAEAPKMAPHIPFMRENIARDLQVEIGAVNVKATTTEKLGYIGRKEGIAVHAVVLLGTSQLLNTHTS